VFLAVVLTLFHLGAQRFRCVLLLISSYLFYAYSYWPHLVLLLLVTTVTFVGSQVLNRRRSPVLLAFVVTLIVLPLVGFKYYNFTAGLVNQIGVTDLGLLDVILPIGISFYTFQAISYIADIFRGAVRINNNFITVALYLAFFPQILAGPIERAKNLIPQLEQLVGASIERSYIGVKYLLWGFFCKLVIADNVALIVDEVLYAPEHQSGGSFLIVFSLYSFQIYFDFYGYTNIAIGIARLFGVRLNSNFARPYLATSIRDFWRRWHITLSTWFRDYVYIPLGGHSTRSTTRLAQVLVVFLLSGLWHGASLNFLAWGGFHGLVYLIEEKVRRYLPPIPPGFPGVLRITVQRCLTFAGVTFAWILFRLSDFADISLVLARVFYLDTDTPYSAIAPLFVQPTTIVVVTLLASAVALDYSQAALRLIDRIPETTREIVAELAVVNWFVVTLGLTSASGVRDFIYFRF